MIKNHSPGPRDLFEPDAVILSKVGEALALENLQKEEAAAEQKKHDRYECREKARPPAKLRIEPSMRCKVEHGGVT